MTFHRAGSAKLNDAGPLRYRSILNVDFVERLDMLRHNRDWHHTDRLRALFPEFVDEFVRCGLKPLLRSESALKGHVHRTGMLQPSADRRYAALDVIVVRIAAFDVRNGQPMSGKQQMNLGGELLAGRERTLSHVGNSLYVFGVIAVLFDNTEHRLIAQFLQSIFYAHQSR